MLTLKIEHRGSLRRSSVPRESSLADVERSVAALLEVGNLRLQYRDGDDDLITIGSQQEWRDVVQEHHDKPLRLIVTEQESPSQRESSNAEQAQSHQQPPIPFSALAEALSKPETVRRMQAVAASPVVTDAVNSVAETYLTSQGDWHATGLAGATQIPMLLGLLNELVDDVPELKQASQQAMAFAAEHFFRGPHHFAHPPPHHPHHGGPFFGMGGGYGGGPCGPSFKTVHPHVFCDGCQSDFMLKRVSFSNGHITRRGNINGLRFKSKQVEDFDLCESCKASGRFPDSAYGPFDTIQPPCAGPHGVPMGHRRAPGGSCWRSGAGCASASAQSAPTASTPSTDAMPRSASVNQPATQAGNSTQKPIFAGSKPFDFGEVIREAIVRGAEKVAEVTKEEDSEFSELAKAIAASLSAGPAEPKTNPSTASAAQPVEVTQKTSDTEWEAVDEPVPITTAAAQSDPFVKWGSQLHQLATLGFSDSETYIRFLEEESGDLDRVVSRIVSREA